MESSSGFTPVRESTRLGEVSLIDRASSTPSTSIRQKQSPSNVCIEQVSKKSPVVSRLRTASPLMEDVKAEILVAENTSESDVVLSCAGRNEYEQLQIDKNSSCMVYEDLFQMPLKAV